MSDLPDYALLNRDLWTRSNAEYTDAQATEAWARDEITWGIWRTPESELNVLPDVAGKDVIELGCGTAYFGAWLRKRGARRVVGIDVTPAQLATARRLDAESGLGLELIEGNAEAVPLTDEQFDLAVSEYGASIWCDTARWIAEAARLLRPGGELVFMRNSTIATLCVGGDGYKVTERLARAQKDLYKLDWGDAVEFQPPHGELIRILRQSGFEILDLVELYAPAGAEQHPYYDYVGPEWGTRWPAEEIWKARKRLRRASDGNE
jgi:ubiquinone/menaquinone biosynthesis C-methylase UbiE